MYTVMFFKTSKIQVPCTLKTYGKIISKMYLFASSSFDVSYFPPEPNNKLF